VDPDHDNEAGKNKEVVCIQPQTEYIKANLEGATTTAQIVPENVKGARGMGASYDGLAICPAADPPIKSSTRTK
jgi:hypothetical protein